MVHSDEPGGDDAGGRHRGVVFNVQQAIHQRVVPNPDSDARTSVDVQRSTTGHGKRSRGGHCSADIKRAAAGQGQRPARRNSG